MPVGNETMNGAYELLKAELQGFVQAIKGHVERCLSLSQAGFEPREQGAVDDRDTLLHRMRDLTYIEKINLQTYSCY